MLVEKAMFQIDNMYLLRSPAITRYKVPELRK